MKRYPYKSYFYGFSLVLSLIFLPREMYSQIAQETQGQGSDMEKSRQLLQLPPQKALSIIKDLSPSEAAIHMSQIRYLVRKRNPDMDRVYFILRHLETLRSTDLAQKRLDNLLWVISSCLLLFSSFLFYIYMKQRSNLRDIGKLLAEKQKEKQESTSFVSPYRGEN